MSPWVCLCNHAPCNGVDCGVLLRWPRKASKPKTQAELTAIRAKAWATRRYAKMKEPARD